MKIQGPRSTTNLNVLETNEANTDMEVQQTQEAQKAPQPTQTNVSASNSERAHRLGELRSQEQMIRSSLQHQIISNINERQTLEGQKYDVPRDRPTDLPPNYSEEARQTWLQVWNESNKHLEQMKTTMRDLINDLGRPEVISDPNLMRNVTDMIHQLDERIHSLHGTLGRFPGDAYDGRDGWSIREAWNKEEAMTDLIPEHPIDRLNGTPSRDFSSDPMNPGRHGDQRDVVETPGNHQVGPSMGPRPGQGGTLTGQGRRDQGQVLTPGGDRSQKSDDGKSHGFGSSNNWIGVRGGYERSNNAPQSPAETSSSRNQGPPNVGAYSHESTPSYTVSEGKKKRDDPQPRTSESKKEPPKKEPETNDDPYSTGIPADPESRGGNDIGGGKFGKYRVKGVTQQVKDLVGPAFGKTTGPDDKERPATGSSSGTVWNASGDDDLGNDLRYGNSGSGGSIDVEIGKKLREEIRPINPGGPDPENN